MLAIEKEFKARQRLHSELRHARGLKSLEPKEGFDCILKVTVWFDEEQMTEKGWYVDIDAIDVLVEKYAAELASKDWSDLFKFRPTFVREIQFSVRKLPQ